MGVNSNTVMPELKRLQMTTVSFQCAKSNVLSLAGIMAQGVFVFYMDCIHIQHIFNPKHFTTCLSVAEPSGEHGAQCPSGMLTGGSGD